MSILSTLIPVEAFAATALAGARPLIGLGLLAALIVLLKPLFANVKQVLRVFLGRESAEERAARNVAQATAMLRRMAREAEHTSPGLAAELRAIATRSQ